MPRIGLISDSHNLLRPEAREFLRGADHIIHAGDIASPDLLEQLAAIAPLTAVRGNNDRGRWAKSLPTTITVRIESVSAYVIHNLAELDATRTKDIHVVVYGHSHRPKIERRAEVIYINPGSAGPRRFNLPVAVGELLIDGSSVTPRIVELACDSARTRRASPFDSDARAGND